MKGKFLLLIAALEEAEVPCRVNLLKDSIILEVGRDVPESLEEAVGDAVNKVGIKWGNELSQCAECCGFEIIESERISGNKRKYK